MLPFAAMRLRSSAIVLQDDLVSMDFEGADGSSTFTDDGTGGSTWTRSDANAEISTAVVLAGTSSLRITSQSTYLSTAYSASNGLPASAPWSIRFLCRSTDWNSGGVGRYLVSAQDSTPTAADTAFGVATSSGAALVLILSDGTTRSVVINYAGPLAINTTYDIEFYRTGTSVGLKVDGITVATATYTGNINMPAGRELRIGKPEFASSAPATFYFDTFRISV